LRVSAGERGGVFGEAGVEGDLKDGQERKEGGTSRD
jgi:hypothetical protein